MDFTQTPLKDAWVIDTVNLSDERGFFARAFCANEFKEHGLNPTIAQGNMSYNYKKGTLRGLHFQKSPATESKLVRCTHGSIYDVIVDIRPDSPTFMQHYGVELSAENRRALYVPEMFAHGYLTLTDDAEVTYLVGEFYTPGVEGGYRYDDPAFGIEWPISVDVVSEKDANWALIDQLEIGN